jgi:hypothetical protein
MGTPVACALEARKACAPVSSSRATPWHDPLAPHARGAARLSRFPSTQRAGMRRPPQRGWGFTVRRAPTPTPRRRGDVATPRACGRSSPETRSPSTTR